ncbi:hypothetical protein L3D22_10095 [Lysobacter soli]|uniref:hypothetical protein n=1 Tax=Lysobacter soli TaxID=453783 RepID=UPI00209EDBA4|nr:hypothetical protein [Lysobacter soli]UTA52747.1 hypothetical protein L3D22_10095 [Lysobacter soli]
MEYSASRLERLPYIVTAAGEKDRVLASTISGLSFARLGTPPNTREIVVPDDVTAVEIYLGNDAFAARRHVPLFRVDLNHTGLTRVVIHELPTIRLSRLQADPLHAPDYPATSARGTARRADNVHTGYLTGDVWKDLSYAFTLTDVARLCRPSTMTRQYAEARGREQIRPAGAPVRYPPTVTDAPRPGLPVVPAITARPPQPVRQGNLETLTIADWSQALSPIYEGAYTGLVGSQHSDWGCTVDLPSVNLRIRYVPGAFSNAIGAGDEITIADVLKRTHPVTYKGAIEAAWKSGIDELSVSSTWRPMLGSVLHRMGVGLDIIFVDDYDDRDPRGRPIERFQVHIDSGARSTLYSTFEAIAFADSANLGGYKSDPWINTNPTHRNHLHVSAIDEDER